MNAALTRFIKNYDSFDDIKKELCYRFISDYDEFFTRTHNLNLNYMNDTNFFLPPETPTPVIEWFENKQNQEDNGIEPIAGNKFFY